MFNRDIDTDATISSSNINVKTKSVEEEEDGGINGLKCHARINNNEITEIDCGLDWRFYALAHKINTPYTASHHPAHKLPVQQCKNNISLFLP